MQDLQHSCTGQEKIRNNVKIRLDNTKERHALLLEANDVNFKALMTLSFVLRTLFGAWKSGGRMNYRQLVFFLRWMIWKERYRLFTIITFLLFKFFLLGLGLLLVSDFGHLYISWPYNFNMIHLSLENQISLTKLAFFENILTWHFLILLPWNLYCSN